MYKLTVLRGAVLLNNALICAEVDPKAHQCYNATRSPIYAIKKATDEVSKDIKYDTTKLTLHLSLASELKELEAKASELDAIVLVEPNNDRYASIYKTLPLEKCGKVIESHWQKDLDNLTSKVRQDFLNNVKFTSVLVKGTNNVGKSLFVKALSNSLYTKINASSKFYLTLHVLSHLHEGCLASKNQKVRHIHFSTIILDIDIGQALYGMPCCIKAMEMFSPILSNFEIKISEEVKGNTVLKQIKSYFINEIAPDSQEEYYVGSDANKAVSTGSKTLTSNGMVRQLFDDVKEAYADKYAVVVINTNGWNSSVGNLIHKSISSIIKPNHEVELQGINYKDSAQLEDNTTHESVEVLEAYIHGKGKKRRNRLQEQELFDFNSSEVLHKEYVPFNEKFLPYGLRHKIPELLLHGKHDYYTLMKLQTLHSYDLKTNYL